jgi:hypothetical protein
MERRDRSGLMLRGETISSTRFKSPTSGSLDKKPSVGVLVKAEVSCSNASAGNVREYLRDNHPRVGNANALCHGAYGQIDDAPRCTEQQQERGGQLNEESGVALLGTGNVTEKIDYPAYDPSEP